MSRMEYNKGKLFPTTLEEVLKDFPNADIDDLSWETRGEYTIINNKIFKVVWEVERGEDPPELLNVTKHSDGSVEFETYHYNGGAAWEEIIWNKI